MSKALLSPSHTIIRWAARNKLTHDPDTLEPIGFQPIAFKLRKGEEYLSAAQINHYGGTHDDQLKAAAAKLAEIVHASPTKGGAFAVGGVSEICADGVKQGATIEAEAAPAKHHPAYVRVWGVAEDDLALQTLLAYNSWSKMALSRDVLS